ncbi:MAG: hypothetical protein U1B83_02085, partial [Candidatus Cloacimonadaceae bacterium]|nr:hypothetical protein [Candidatus Cloacimonadaceae bacterium]
IDQWLPDTILMSSEAPVNLWQAVSMSSGGLILNYAQVDSNQVEQSYLRRYDADGNQVGQGPLLAPGAFPEPAFMIRELSSNQYLLWHVGNGDPCNLILQKMDAVGNLLLPQALSLSLPSSAGSSSTLYNHVSISPLSDGGLLISWSYDAASISYQHRVQRLSPDWQALWNAAGITVTPNHPNSSFRVREDAQQHFFCTWTERPSSNTWQVKAQRISPAGDLLWGAGGVQVDANRPFMTSFLGFCGAGQYHCLWYTWEDSHYRLKRQTLDATGTPQLAVGGEPFVSQLGGWSSKHLSIALAGAFFSFWQDVRPENNGIYFQKSDAEMNTYLSEAGKRLLAPSPSATQVLCQVEKLADDRIAVLYYYYGANSSYYVQIVDAEGEVLLPNSGYFVGNNLINPVIDCFEGDIYLAWMTEPAPPNQYLLKAQRFVAGQIAWEAGGKAIAWSPASITSINVKNRYFSWKQSSGGTLQSCVRRVDANGFIQPGWIEALNIL